MMVNNNSKFLFDRIASSYDKVNHLLSLNIDKRWRRRAVRGMQEHEEVLDVAIGTADLAIELLRQGKAKTVTGLDLSVEMMKVGQSKTIGLPVTFVEGSAQAMPFEDNSFDALTCGFGCRNFTDLDAGLNEFYRVLKVGGELCIVEFSYPTNPLIRWCYSLYFNHLMPLIGGWASHDKPAYLYLNSSVRHFIWGEEMAAHLRAAGFQFVTFQPLTCGIATLYRARIASKL